GDDGGEGAPSRYGQLHSEKSRTGPRRRLVTAEKEDEQAAGGEERPEGDRLLPGADPLAREHEEGDDPAREKGECDRCHDRPPERGTEKRGQLDVSHSHPRGVDQHRDEEEERRT